jgi:hypothetical protein
MDRSAPRAHRHPIAGEQHPVTRRRRVLFQQSSHVPSLPPWRGEPPGSTTGPLHRSGVRSPAPGALLTLRPRRAPGDWERSSHGPGVLHGPGGSGSRVAVRPSPQETRSALDAEGARARGRGHQGPRAPASYRLSSCPGGEASGPSPMNAPQELPLRGLPALPRPFEPHPRVAPSRLHVHGSTGQNSPPGLGPIPTGRDHRSVGAHPMGAGALRRGFDRGVSPAPRCSGHVPGTN